MQGSEGADGFADKADFETIMQSLLAAGGKGSFGKIHLVSILSDEQESVLGQRLPKAIAIAEKIIQSRLSQGDVCQRLSAGKYILVFPGLTDAEGTVKATAISQEIRGRLFGQAAGPIQVTVQVLPVSRLKARGLAVDAESMLQVLDAQASKSGVQLDVVFQPIWDREKQQIIGNRAITRRAFQGHYLYDDAVQFAGEQDPLAIQRNAILQEAVLSCAAIPGAVFLPQAINDHALTDPSQLTAVVRLLKQRCPGGLVIELTGAVASLPHARLRHAIKAVADGGGLVGVRIFPEPDMARFLKESGASYLCFNEAQAKTAGFTHSALYALLAVIAHEVQGLGFKPCLWNASTGQDLKRASQLGFFLFSGDPIGVMRPQMTAPHRLATAELYL